MSADLINQPELYESTAKPETEKERLRVATGELTAGKDYDRVDVTYPSAAVEVFTFSLSAVVVRVVTITYTSSSKKDLLSVVVT